MVKKIQVKGIKINFSNKLFYTFIVIGLSLAIGAGVHAYTTDGSGDPSIMGHSAGELEGGSGVGLWERIGTDNDIYYNSGNVRVGKGIRDTDIPGIFDVRSGSGSTRFTYRERVYRLESARCYCDTTNGIDCEDDFASRDPSSRGRSRRGSSPGTICYDQVTTDYKLGDYSRKYIAEFIPTLLVQNGRIGVNTFFPEAALDINGIVKATSFVYTSDKSLKENIEIIPSALDKVMTLKGVSFEWIADETNDKNLGFIAQDVEKVLPEVVSTGENGLKAVEYGNIVAVLVEAIKEQQEEIEELKLKLDN